VRAPDIAFIANPQIPNRQSKGFLTTPPDLVIETLSPSDRATEVSEKIQWWLGHGVREAWVVDAENQSITIHRGDGSSRRYGIEEAISGNEVVPGLNLALRDVFA
jgi:Uma2 family endonuclease